MCAVRLGGRLAVWAAQLQVGIFHSIVGCDNKHNDINTRID